MEVEKVRAKPIVNWNEFIEETFAEGRCECGRCVDSNYNESDYEAPHTFVINEITYRRKFAKSYRDAVA
jgi:hypothetical protein